MELDNLNIVMGFLITDCKAQWCLTLEQGHLVKTISDSSENPEVLFEMESETFLQIISGAISPQKSFFANRVKLQGDTLKALKMVSIFEQFIKEHPFQIPEAFTSKV